MKVRARVHFRSLDFFMFLIRKGSGLCLLIQTLQLCIILVIFGPSANALPAVSLLLVPAGSSPAACTYIAWLVLAARDYSTVWRPKCEQTLGMLGRSLTHWLPVACWKLLDHWEKCRRHYVSKLQRYVIFSSFPQWLGSWIQEVSIKPATYLRIGYFLTVYRVKIVFKFNVQSVCHHPVLLGVNSHKDITLLSEACCSFICWVKRVAHFLSCILFTYVIMCMYFHQTCRFFA